MARFPRLTVQDRMMFEPIKTSKPLRSIARGIVLFSLPLLGHSAAANMISIPAGSYRIGTDAGPSDARPAHEVRLAPFRIDATEVTNAEFVRFLETLNVRIVGNAQAGRARSDDVQGPDA